MGVHGERCIQQTIWVCVPIPMGPGVVLVVLEQASAYPWLVVLVAHVRMLRRASIREHT